MVAVSEAWRVAQNQTLAPEGFVEISYEVTEPGLHDAAIESDNGSAFWANSSEIANGLRKNAQTYISCEHNYWGLDGSLSPVPDSSPYGNTGFVSSVLSDADCVFTQTPTVTIAFSAVREQPLEGITINWGDEFPTDFSVTAYNETTVVNRTVITGNEETVSVVMLDMVGYNKITIVINKWQLPYHRARIVEIFLGIKYTLTKKDLISYTHEQTGDSLSASLPKNAITFSIDNTKMDFNPDNLSGRYKYIAERQKLTVRYGFMIDDVVEWIPGGTFFLCDWSVPSNGLEATFTARDLLEFMGSVYAGAKNGTLYDISTAALMQAELPVLSDGSNPWYIDDTLRDIVVDFNAVTTEFTIDQILQMCANAACCVMYQDRNGVLRIERMRKNYSGYAIKRFHSLSFPEYTMYKELKAVDVNNGLAVVSNSTHGETQTVSNELIQDAVQASRVGDWVRKALINRNQMSGDFRADPRVDVFDVVGVESKYGTNRALVLSEIKYTFGGAFKGSYKGRVTDFTPEKLYSGEIKAGEMDNV